MRYRIKCELCDEVSNVKEAHRCCDCGKMVCQDCLRATLCTECSKGIVPESDDRITSLFDSQDEDCTGGPWEENCTDDGADDRHPRTSLNALKGVT